MNAVVALCSFCDLHGPSILFCTQTFHEDSKPSDFTRDEDAASVPKKDWYGPDYFTKRASSMGSDSIFPPHKSMNCDGCTSMTDERRGFIDNDHKARISYVSCQYPLHPDVFSIVRQACVRSLSCEVCPGREGPIFFGDDDNGYILSHTFFVKDSQARGSQSFFSVVVVMRDKIFLLNSWPFLVHSLQRMIQEIQEKAVLVFNVEQSEHSQRVRLNSVTGLTMDTFRRRRGNVKARSIIDMTNDKDFFSHLHASFTWLLKSGAERLYEKVLESYPTEDAVVTLERQKDLDGEIIQLHVTKVEDKDIPSTSFAASEVTEQMEALQMKENGIKFVSLRELHKTIGKESFLCLAFHTIMGNQIIVKSVYLPLMKSMITCLKDLIPTGCFHPIYYSVIYEDSWKCNFLGLVPDTKIPDHVNSSELHIQINIRQRQGSEEISSIGDFEFDFHTTAQMPKKLPQILVQMEGVIADDTFSQQAMDSFFFTIKQKWLNKAKVLFAFSKGQQRTSEETNKLFTVLEAYEQDKMLLQFWMTGLSSQYKSYILSSGMPGKSDSQGASSS